MNNVFITEKGTTYKEIYLIRNVSIEPHGMNDKLMKLYHSLV